jgi:RNA polymerase sigma factor (sigma-70 family)
MSPKLLTGAARAASSSLLRAQSDARLAQLAAAGHEAAFEAIVARHRPELLRYCRGLVGPARAEDAVQQAFLNAHLAMSSTPIDNLRAWLHRVAHNAAVNLLRAGRDEASIDDRLAAPDTLAMDLEVRDRLRSALQAIAALPEPQRDALMLQVIDGRSHEDIAAALELTPAAARQTVHRARATLRAAVTAITPYPLLARLAAGSVPGGGSGLPEAAVGGGTLASAGKVGAAVLAAGAITGGAITLPADRPAKADRPTATQTTERRAAATPPPVTPPAAVVPAALAEDDGSDRAPVHRAERPRPARSRDEDSHRGPGGDNDIAERDDDDDHSGPSGGDEEEHRRDRSGDDDGAEDRSGPSSEDDHEDDVESSDDEDQTELLTTEPLEEDRSGSSDGGDDGGEDELELDEDHSGSG